MKTTTREYDETPIINEDYLRLLICEKYDPLYHCLYTENINKFVESFEGDVVLPDGDSAVTSMNECYEKIIIQGKNSYETEQVFLCLLRHYIEKKHNENKWCIYWRQRPCLWHDPRKNIWYGSCRLLLSDKKKPIEEDKKGKNRRENRNQKKR